MEWRIVWAWVVLGCECWFEVGSSSRGVELVAEGRAVCGLLLLCWSNAGPVYGCAGRALGIVF